MTKLEKYTNWIEEYDKNMRLEEPLRSFLKSIDPEVRARLGAFHIDEAMAYMFPVTATLVKIAFDVLQGFPDKVDKGDMILVGWTIVRPLVNNNILSLKRQSQFIQNGQAARTAEFENYEKLIRQGNAKKGDWTTYMFVTGSDENADDFLFTLSLNIPPKERNPRQLIYNHKPLDWTEWNHPEFGPLSSRPSKRARELFRGNEKTNKTLQAVNKLQGTAFRINEEVYNRINLSQDDIRTRIDRSSESIQSAASKKRELNEILKASKENLGKDVYSCVNLDFRGRTYYTARYLNRSGNDYAKGLLGIEPEEIGIRGFDNLLVAAVDFRDKGTQAKMSYADKLSVAYDDVDDFIAVANGADFLTFIDDDGEVKDVGEPAQFLAVCIDIRNADSMGAKFNEYKSGVLLSRDASQSGPMLMGIATQDEMAMKYTNVLEDTKRYDLYEYMGGVMLDLLKSKEVTPGSVAEKPVGDFESALWASKNKIALEAKAKADFLELFNSNPGAVRKWAKYPLMLFGYSAQDMCIANDLWDRFNSKYEWLTPVHVVFIAKLFYEACKVAIPRVYEFMQGMKEFGSRAHKMGRDVEVVSSYGKYPFVQQYRTMVSNKQKITYSSDGESTRIRLCYKEKTDKRNIYNVKSGTPANLVHSIDSDLLKMVVNEFDGTIATNHDAFFATAGKINELDRVLRECTYKMGTEYDLVESAIEPYGLTPEDLNIKINPLNPSFNPMANEFCYS